MPRLLHLAIDSVRVIFAGEKDPDDDFYDTIVSVPQVGKNCGQRFIKMMDEEAIKAMTKAMTKAKAMAKALVMAKAAIPNKIRFEPGGW